MRGQIDADLLKRWREADGRFDRAPEGLTERLGWLHRAMGALDEGKPEPIAALAASARAAGQTDIALILELCATPTEQIDPSAWRRLAKAKKPPNQLENFPDYVRALASLRHQKRPTNLPKMSNVPRERPAEYALIMSLSSRANTLATLPTLTQLMPRATLVMLATWMAREQMYFHLTRDTKLADLKLSPERYPDIHQRTGPAATLEARTRGDEPWSLGHDPIAQYLFGLPVNERKSWLGAMLHRLARDTRAGRFVGLGGLCHAAVHVAERFPELQLLARQLAALDLRLGWLTSEEPDRVPLLGRLWHEQHRQLSPPERLALAQRLVKFADHTDEDGDPSIRDDVLDELHACVIAGAADLEQVAENAASLADMSRDALEALLKRFGASEARRALAHGISAATRRELDTALIYVARLRESAPELGVLIVEIHRLSSLFSPTRAFRRNLSHMLGEPASQPVARALARLAGLAAEVPIRFRDTVLALLPKVAAEDMGEAIGLALSVGAADVASEQIKLLGRALRRLPAAQATERALAAIARTLYLVEPSSPKHPVYAQLEPLTRFALRDGPQPILDFIRRTSLIENSPASGLLHWILRDPTMFGDLTQLADALSHALAPKGAPPLAIDGPFHPTVTILVGALKRGPCTPAELMQRLQARVEEFTRAPEIAALLEQLNGPGQPDFARLARALLGRDD